MNIKSEKSIGDYLKTLSDDTIIKYYIDVEFSPFPILVIKEYARRFNKKTKNEILKDLEYQGDLARTKVQDLKKAVIKGKQIDEISQQKSDEILNQAKKKGYEISDSFLKKSGVFSSKLKAKTRSTIKQGIKKGQNFTNSSEKNLEILEKLGELKKKGIITEKEFQEKKKKILSKI